MDVHVGLDPKEITKIKQWIMTLDISAEEKYSSVIYR